MYVLIAVGILGIRSLNEANAHEWVSVVYVALCTWSKSSLWTLVAVPFGICEMRCFLSFIPM